MAPKEPDFEKMTLDLESAGSLEEYLAIAEQQWRNYPDLVKEFCQIVIPEEEGNNERYIH